MKANEEDANLAYDNSAYEMLHKITLEWPCLSIDFILPDRLNPAFEYYNPSQKIPEGLLVDYTDPENSEKTKRHRDDKYPYTAFIVGGSQADNTSKNANKIYVMKITDMHKTQNDDDSDVDDDPNNLDEDAILLFDAIPVDYPINRIRSMNNSTIVATWNVMAEVSIFDTSAIIDKMGKKDKKDKKRKKKKSKKNKYKISGFKHQQEGYALDWSYHKKGLLASGGQDGQIFTYSPSDQSFSNWDINKSPLQGHSGSVEDIQFSPTEDNALASCSTDKSIKIWDLRANPSHNSQITFIAHEGDANVIAWNPACAYLLASGGDEGAFKVWDLRYLKRGGTLTNIKWHKGPITSLQFQPREESVLAVSSEDNKLTIWDFGVEKDEEELKDPIYKEIPRQLMFLHQGQEDIKELK